MLEETNIKSRLQIFIEGQNRPTISVQEFNQLKATMQTARFEYEVGKTIATQDDGDYEIYDIKFRVFQEESSAHMEFGVDTSLQGNPQPYNSEIEVYIRKV